MVSKGGRALPVLVGPEAKGEEGGDGDEERGEGVDDDEEEEIDEDSGAASESESAHGATRSLGSSMSLIDTEPQVDSFGGTRAVGSERGAGFRLFGFVTGGGATRGSTPIAGNDTS